MTGEITLSGLVFPVGGIKGKVLAARRSGMRRVVLPKKNEPDLKDIPEEALRDLEIVFVDRVDELLPQTLVSSDQPGPSGDVHKAVPTGSDLVVDGGEARAQAEGKGGSPKK
jgi:ATP-dependent Lon protease